MDMPSSAYLKFLWDKIYVDLLYREQWYLYVTFSVRMSVKLTDAFHQS